MTITFAVPQPLQEAYRFRPGQHLTLKASFDGEELRRCYSICRSYLPGEISVAVKTIEGGRFSRYAREHIRQGMTLEVMVPQGHFGYQPQAERQGRYLAIAGRGSGITPMLAIIATTLQTEPESQFTLIYGNRPPEHDVSPGTGRPERQILSAFTVVVHFQSGNPRQRSASQGVLTVKNYSHLGPRSLIFVFMMRHLFVVRRR
ncbi:FAD-binding oxidoreductase [Escherichia coli]